MKELVLRQEFEIKVISEISNILKCSYGDAQGALEAYEMNTWVKHPLLVLRDQNNTPAQAAKVIIR